MANTMISAGGGLSKSKLALATATESDVASGKTFYAGDKTIKTGTSLGNKFKETFNNLSSASRILLWTNSNHTNNNTGSVTANTGSQLYAAYYIYVKRYSSTTDGSGFIVVRGASRNTVGGIDRNIYRMVSISGSRITVGTPYAGETSHWESTIVYQIYGIKGTEL